MALDLHASRQGCQVMPATLYHPVSIRHVTLANRLVLAPMSRMRSAPSGTPSEEACWYYARYAAQGVGLLVTEATYVDDVASRAYFDQPGLWNDEQTRAWEAVADAVHAQGGRILVQLQHAGRLAEPGLHDFVLGPTSSAAAGVSWQTNLPYAPATTATPDQLAGIAQAFGAAARRAVEAGFDGVEIHGARGYLIDQFLSASSNQREDEFGGTLAGRLTFPLLVVQCVRGAIGPQPILSFNLSLYKMDDVHYEPPGGAPEVEEIARALEQAGVDIIHATSRRAPVPVSALGGDTLAQVVRRGTARSLVAAGGGIVSVPAANEWLATGACDLVSIGRALAANPDLLARTDDPRPYRRGMERDLVARTDPQLSHGTGGQSSIGEHREE